MVRSIDPDRDPVEPTDRVVVAVATPLEPELVAVIRAVDPRLAVLYEPDLLPTPRYPGDHKGAATFRRSPEQQDRWRAMLGSAEVFFGLPGDTGEGLAEGVRIAPRLLWVQATAAGAGEQVRAARLTAEELERVAITTASGIHGGELAEFALFGLLAFTKDLPRLAGDKADRRWGYYPVEELRGRTILIVGFGSIGEEIGRLAKAFGMRVVGINRSGRIDSPNVDEMHDQRSLDDLLPQADAVAIALPSTSETRRMFDAHAFELMSAGAIFINVGRGSVVDEDALVAALKSGRLRGAALDVFATEPLPADSPLWDLPNVLISPHTAALSVHENERIVGLFCDNLRRYLAGEELVNRVDRRLLY
jgi:phosphoglycerate dehydrogenase-like enzyme